MVLTEAEIEDTDVCELFADVPVQEKHLFFANQLNSWLKEGKTLIEKLI